MVQQVKDLASLLGLGSRSGHRFRAGPRSFRRPGGGGGGGAEIMCTGGSRMEKSSSRKSLGFGAK